MMLGDEEYVPGKRVHSPLPPSRFKQQNFENSKPEKKEESPMYHEDDSDNEESEDSDHDFSTVSNQQQLRIDANSPNRSDGSIVSSVNSPPNKKSPLKGGKKVSFAADTILPKDDNFALSITKHLYTRELGYTQYHIQLLFRGVEWTVYKRYRDFTTFHQNMMLENAKYQIPIPDLPKKRWFEKQRWLNKFDETYSLNRRNALQEYLRILAKTPIIKLRFTSFHEFLEIPWDRIPHEDGDDRDFSAEEKSPAATFTNTDNPAYQEFATSPGDFPAPEDRSSEYEEQESFSEQAPRRDLKTAYRDSILETSLEQQFDDEGDVIVSRP